MNAQKKSRTTSPDMLDHMDCCLPWDFVELQEVGDDVDDMVSEMGRGRHMVFATGKQGRSTRLPSKTATPARSATSPRPRATSRLPINHTTMSRSQYTDIGGSISRR